MKPKKNQKKQKTSNAKNEKILPEEISKSEFFGNGHYPVISWNS